MPAQETQRKDNKEANLYSSADGKGSIRLLVVGSTLLLGIGVFLYSSSGAVGATDTIPPAAMQQRLEVFKTIPGIEAGRLDRDDPLIYSKARRALHLPPAEQSALNADLMDGKVALVELEVWDDMAQDGDVIKVSLGGYTRDVPLLHERTKVMLPVPSQGTSKVSITGVKDGGGGITAAAKTVRGEVPFPVLSVGEQIEVPLL